jgi:hypothetical protein
MPRSVMVATYIELVRGARDKRELQTLKRELHAPVLGASKSPIRALLFTISFAMLSGAFQACIAMAMNY